MSELENSGDPAPIELQDLAGGHLPSDLRRRRLVKSAIATGSVILTLKGQSALAATGCASPSRIISGVPSQKPGTPPPCGVGKSPGYWKVCQHLGEWASAGVTAPTFKSCVSGMPPKNSQLTEGALFSDLFTGAGTLGVFGCWRILAYPTQVDKALEAFNTEQIQLARHLIATYLNSKTVANFPLTSIQIQEMWTEGSVGNYCPASVSCTVPWTTRELVCYLRNYTMDSASVSLDPIPWVCSDF